MGVEVVEVVGREDAEVVEQPPRQLEPRGELVAVGGDQLGENVAAVEEHARAPT